MESIVNSIFVNFGEGIFQCKAKKLRKKYGDFDFVWFDCGGVDEYKAFFSEYWDICSYYIICHFTYSNGKANDHLLTILDAIK